VWNVSLLDGTGVWVCRQVHEWLDLLSSADVLLRWQLPLPRSKEAKNGVNILCYRLDKLWSVIWPPARARGFPLLQNIQTRSESPLAFLFNEYYGQKKGQKRLGHEGDNLSPTSTMDKNTYRHTAIYGVYRHNTYQPCLWLQSDIQLFGLNISHISRLSLAQCSSFLLIRPF